MLELEFPIDLPSVKEHIKEAPITFVIGRKRIEDSFEKYLEIFLAPLSDVYEMIVNNNDTDRLSFVVYDKKNEYSKLAVYSEYKYLDPLGIIDIFKEKLNKVGINTGSFTHIPDKKTWPIKNNLLPIQKTE